MAMQNTEMPNNLDENLQRRTANYKPNIWNYNLFQTLTTTKYLNEEYKAKAEKLKEEVKCRIFNVKMSQLSKLELIDSIVKLGLSSYFDKEIREALEPIATTRQPHAGIKEDLYAASLFFRLLRQFGYNPNSQDSFEGFVDETGKFSKSTESNVKAWTELFHASNLGGEGEQLMHEARTYATDCLMNNFGANSDGDHHDELIKKQEAINALLRLPLNWRCEWYNIKRHINEYENHEKYKPNSTLVELAKLNFNILQATQQEDLKEITRWWLNLGVIKKLSFSRDRMVESFMYAGGVAFEPQYGSLRKWLSKVIKLVLIIDDVYDVYGSLDELEYFSHAVDSWKIEDAKELPECMKICFQMLLTTTEEIGAEIHKEKGWNLVLPHLKKAWADFCKSLLMEAKWYNKGYTPSLEEYLENGWISSSGPLLSLHIILATANPSTIDHLDHVPEILRDNQELIHYTSLIIRLCNDQGTSAAEVERGDAPSSIVCYMREWKDSEETAREHMRGIIMNAWKKINSHCMRNGNSFSGEPAKYIINTARVAHFIYHHRDGFGVQDRREVLSNLIEPLLI